MTQYWHKSIDPKDMYFFSRSAGGSTEADAYRTLFGAIAAARLRLRQWRRLTSIEIARRGITIAVITKTRVRLADRA